MISLKKTLFTFYIDNVVDVITNSSSELFVLEGETLSIVEEMIENVYPKYTNEYAKPIHISALDIESLDSFFNYACGSNVWPATKQDYHVPVGFTFDEVYEPEKDGETGKEEPPACNGHIQYQVKDNTIRKPDERYHMGSFVTESNKEYILSKLDPERKLYFMYSLDENPDWDMQEKLMEIGQRYHL